MIAYYIAFHVQRPVYDNTDHAPDRAPIFEAGVDLLDGPFRSYEAAEKTLPLVLRRVRRYYPGAYLAVRQFPGCEIRIMSTTRGRVGAINRRELRVFRQRELAGELVPGEEFVAVPYPLPIVECMQRRNMLARARARRDQMKKEMKELEGQKCFSTCGK